MVLMIGSAANKAISIMYKMATNPQPHIRYQMPFLGKTFKAIDQYADAQKMYNDYARNVGRKIQYASIRDPRNTTSNIFDTAMSGANTIKGAGKTVRSLL